MQIIGFTFGGLALLFLLLIIIVPIIVKSSIKSSYTEKVTPKTDNINLWGHFPGEIKSKITHTFNVLDYSEEKVKIKDSIILEENVLYDNVKSSGEYKLSFDAKSKYVLSNKPKNETIKSFSLGMFETFETISNPMQYQSGMNSLEYLLKKAFTKPELFLRQIFTYCLFNKLNEEEKRDNILKNITQEKADLIFSDDEQYAEYSFKNITGFYKWIKILGLPDEINKATWLNSLFNLTETEVDSIFGENEYLYQTYVDYNKDLSKKFNCSNVHFCGKEILYIQLVSGDVLKSIGLEEGVKSLYDSIEPKYYQFAESPELNLFFEKYKEMHKLKNNYTDYAPSPEQLMTIFDPSSNLCLLAPNNSALFLSLNKCGYYNNASELFNVTKNTFNFLADYIYEYLPNLFLYNETDKIAKAYVTLTQGVMKQTYGLLVKSTIYDLILSGIVWPLLRDQISLMTNKDLKQLEPDEICPLIMQRALDDGKKVLKVCSNPKTSFYSADTLSKWLRPYDCIKNKTKTNCDMSVINDLKSLIYITDSEIQNIYDPDLLGGILEEKEAFLKEKYKCGDDCRNYILMAKKQFWKGELSKNLPEPLKNSSTLSEVFPDTFPYPIEISYYAEQMGETDEIPEEQIDELISLCPIGENVLSEESSEALKTKIQLEKEYTLIVEGKKERNETKYKNFDLLNNGYLFNNETNSTYKNIYNFLSGNNDEDYRYVKFLSSGPLFENYKPKLNQTTGFNFGIDFNKSKDKNLEYDRYEIFSKLNDDNTRMRKILSINDLPILNIKKLEYNYLLNDVSAIASPIMNFQALRGDKSFIDGFQYEVEDEDKSIYYYDKISNRPFEFKYEEDSDYEDIDCKLYKLNKENLIGGINEENESQYKRAFLTQKLNKPFAVTVGNTNLTLKIDGLLEDNYICIDPFTNLVLDSKINLVYSIYTKNYGYIYPKIENNKNYPIFTYNRKYEVDIDSYKDNFPDITFYYTFKLIFIIIGLILIICFIAVSLWAFVRMHKSLIKDDIINNEPDKDKLLDSREEPSIINRSTEKNN